MEIILKKKPKNPVIIEGFPGFGLVGTIATEFLIDHLETEQIGKIMFEDSPPIAAIHEGNVVEPLGIFYNKKYNIVVLHAVNPVNGIEWKVTEALSKIAKQLNATEIVSLEGVGSVESELTQSRIFFFTKDRKRKEKFEKVGMKILKEGIIMGVTGAILLRMEKVPVSCIFVETHTNLPDSKAAAKIVQALDKYLGLKVDYKPLLQQAEKFEEKLKGLLIKSKEAEELSEKKKLSYVG